LLVWRAHVPVRRSAAGATPHTAHAGNGELANRDKCVDCCGNWCAVQEGKDKKRKHKKEKREKKHKSKKARISTLYVEFIQ